MGLSYPQDVVSRQFLNKIENPPTSFALVVVVGRQVVEMQRWQDGRRMHSISGPPGTLLDFSTTQFRLNVFTKRQAWEWNPKDGALLERLRKKGEQVTTLFESTPGSPQFRGHSDWCCVIIDGDTKACSPEELFNNALKKWRSLSPTERVALLGKPALTAFGGHLKGALRILGYVAAAVVLVVPVLWYYYTHF